LSELSDADVAILCGDIPDAMRIILTIRGRDEGGGWDGDDADRVSRMIELGPLATDIDVEAALWSRSANIRQKIQLAARRARHVSVEDGRERITHDGRRRLILSRHAPRDRPARLGRVVMDLMTEPACDIAKIAWLPRSVRDNFEALELVRDAAAAGRQLIAICLGDDGLASRVLAPKFGAALMFAATGPDAAAAPGQLDMATLLQTYRWRRINPHTRVFGLIGDPVAHSLGPRAHNAAFETAGLNAVYIPLRVRAGYESFKALMVELRARPWLDVDGLSVTAPHKEHALRYALETGGDADALTRRIGAANTLKLGPDGSVAACNTDAPAIAACLSREATAAAAAGRRAVVLGAGGVARAAVAALVESGVSVTISGRSAERSDAVARALGATTADWRARHHAARDADIIINATPVGQTPHIDDTPLDADALHDGATVMDTVYRPAETRLLREAEARGCRVVGGPALFVGQAEAQWRHWFGHAPPDGAIRAASQGPENN
jgi:3-dehydroquinate dehydratase/shikimate dehydrogenase